ncbi:hypothetical protein RFI_17733 [Reticulomyxa filosa]|uniref:Uncharacterized protein n=1 Tax=Reticulomyxa filosa TaxID=46433 RepID=X6N0R8_RETFI|nr:hypothetical protein RFI_17733 [Reticulomyxa filosa]|eukprot:ETO19493.1 hypothetical protein RFI_17733 [Reticulomyxa filosa]
MYKKKIQFKFEKIENEGNIKNENDSDENNNNKEEMIWRKRDHQELYERIYNKKNMLMKTTTADKLEIINKKNLLQKFSIDVLVIGTYLSIAFKKDKTIS